MEVNTLQRIFEEYLKEGIHHECTISNTLEQNGVAERLIRYRVISSFDATRLSREFWAEAISTAVYLRNHPTKQLTV